MGNKSGGAGGVQVITTNPAGPNSPGVRNVASKSSANRNVASTGARDVASNTARSVNSGSGAGGLPSNTAGANSNKAPQRPVQRTVKIRQPPPKVSMEEVVAWEREEERKKLPPVQAVQTEASTKDKKSPLSVKKRESHKPVTLGPK